MPMYGKPAPTRWMASDLRTHYPNGSKIQYTCESGYHTMFEQITSRQCINRKWIGKVGTCGQYIPNNLLILYINLFVSEINYGKVVKLTHLTSYTSDGKTILEEYYTSAQNNSKNETNSPGMSYYGNAYGNLGRQKCITMNVESKQLWRLQLNDSVLISSFVVYIQPGGMFGGFTTLKDKMIPNRRPIAAKIGRTNCEPTTIHDYPPRTTIIVFRCDMHLRSNNGRVDHTDLYLDPTKFDKKFDQQNISLCSLMIFHSTESCGIPDKPLNSFVKISNQIAYYSCEDGYELIGLSLNVININNFIDYTSNVY